jgi:hypothetical protein
MHELPRRDVAKLLSGYLCGTHSGLLALGRSGRQRRAGPELIVSAHRALEIEANGQVFELGRKRWEPSEQRVLAEGLRLALAHPHVDDLVLYGSQARAGRTGFSDVDALLIVSDEVANDKSALRSLRPYVLRAQRAVLSYQPMQHHGFEVATPTLLRAASESLALPLSALQETRSLSGRAIPATVTDRTDQSRVSFSQLATSVERARVWPGHPWEAHRLVAMFELLPSLYLQVRGAVVPKWRSFDEGRDEFGAIWWPYDVLREVRQVWPRLRHRSLEQAANVARNPWVPIAAWRRVPARLPGPVDELLTDRLLGALRSLAATMRERAS